MCRVNLFLIFCYEYEYLLSYQIDYNNNQKAKSVNEISKGTLNVELIVPHKDELGNLVKAFNEMTV